MEILKFNKFMNSIKSNKKLPKFILFESCCIPVTIDGYFDSKYSRRKDRLDDGVGE